jgi:hypothetical protein
MQNARSEIKTIALVALLFITFSACGSRRLGSMPAPGLLAPDQPVPIL